MNELNEPIKMLKPAMFFWLSYVGVSIASTLIKKLLGAEDYSSLILSMFLVGVAAWIAIRPVIKKHKRTLEISEKIKFCLLTVFPLFLFLSLFLFIVKQPDSASLGKYIFAVSLTTFISFCGVWLVISTMTASLFKEYLEKPNQSLKEETPHDGAS
ncbi:MAG: hypothetical protein RIB78_09245 [Gammaproteobacteria bacterium]